MINVEVVYVLPQQQTVLHLTMPDHSTIRDAIMQSKLFNAGIEQLNVGIFGRLRSIDFPLQAGDRVEIYRPLYIDPKLARTIRVTKERSTKGIKKHRHYATKAMRELLAKA